MTKMLYLLGAGIVLVGISFFFAQLWPDIGSFGRIILTLGFGLLMTGLGAILIQDRARYDLGNVFYAIGGLLVPGGVVVTLEQLPDAGAWPYALAFLALAVFYSVLSVLHKTAILTFFAIANATAATYLLVGAILEPIARASVIADILRHLTLVVGTSYLVLAHAFKTGWVERLVGPLHFFGSLGLLGTGILLVFDFPVWELLYFFLVGGVLLVSVYLKSRSALIMSTLFLVIHISYITAEYFADSLGWPVVLVLLGFTFIGLGYGSIKLNNRYLTE